MTDHHHPDPEVPTVLYTVTNYVAGGVERELLLVDMPRLGLTLLDLLADSDDDQHIVADGLSNCAEAGKLADAHVAASIVAGRPAVPTAEPPTSEQLRCLRELGERAGDTTFEPPRSRAEATKWLRGRYPGDWDPRRATRESWEAANAGRTTTRSTEHVA
jgi:hypothetical protein